MSAGEDTLAAALAVWWIVSALCQAHWPVERWLRARDLFSLIPHWHFFAPRPGQQDYYLLFRDRTRDGLVSPWREVAYSQTARGVSVFWNPGRRHNKALVDVTLQLAQLGQAVGAHLESLTLTVPYLAILNFVSRLPRIDHECETQFLLMASDRRRPGSKPEVLLVSALHPLAD